MRLHHVQVACPVGGEDAVRGFYAGALGLSEVEKPASLRVRGGAWFCSHDDTGAVVAELHVGVEDPFHPSRKAHPAFLLDTVEELDAVATRIESLGHDVDRSQHDTLPGYVRWHAADPHGNRVELLAPA